MGVKKALTAVVLAVALAAPSAGFAQSQVDKTGTGGAAAGQEIAGVPVVGIAIGAAVAVAIGVAVAAAASDDASNVSLKTTTTTFSSTR